MDLKEDMTIGATYLKRRPPRFLPSSYRYLCMELMIFCALPSMDGKETSYSLHLLSYSSLSPGAWSIKPAQTTDIFEDGPCAHFH